MKPLRLIIIVVVILAGGSAALLTAVDLSPPKNKTEIVIPDDRFPR